MVIVDAIHRFPDEPCWYISQALLEKDAWVLRLI